jgi:hypothetical protein
VSVSQPFSAFVSQFPYPVWQSPTVHLPATHAAAAFVFAAQGLSQEPQCSADVSVSTQALPHWLRPPSHSAPPSEPLLPPVALEPPVPESVPPVPPLEGSNSSLHAANSPSTLSPAKRSTPRMTCRR